MADVVKYGVQIPNRIFVGGIAFDTKEEELREFFKQHGKVKDCKIVSDKDGFSRGFGFVTFESKQEAIQTQKLGTVFFNQKKLNLGPAIRQKGVVFNAAQEAANEPVTSAGVYIHPSGYCYTVAPNGVWYFHSNGGAPEDDPVSQSPCSTVMSSTQSTTAPVPITQQHSSPPMPPPMPAQSPPAVVPMKFVPAENFTQQSCPVYSHYVIPQNATVPNNSPVEPQTRFINDSNVIPYYITQPQPQVAPMNPYPMTTLPSQIHHVPPPPPSVHVIQAPFPTQALPLAPRAPEVYQVYNAPYDPSIIEHGPFMSHNSRTITSGMMRPTIIRPNGPIKRVTAELPPQRLQLRRNYDTLVQVNGRGSFTGSTGSGGSTPASSSSSNGDLQLEQKE